MLRRAGSRGFTLVELMVGVALIAIALGLGAPAMGTYLQNAKLASATQTYFSGVQTARAEAIHRNLAVEFVLTDTAVDTADLANSLTPSVSGVNWAVRAASDVSGAAYTLIEAKSGKEGTVDNNAPAPVQISASGPSGFDGTISFNGFGGTSDSGAYTLDISNSAAGACVAAGGSIRCKRIRITPGGQIQACDPAASAADSRACSE